MPITFHIPAYLAAFAEGQRSVKLASSPATVHDAFEGLWRVHPGLRDRILDEQGEVRQHINVFVGQDSIRFAGGLATQVPDKSEILIVPAVSGGNGKTSPLIALMTVIQGLCKNQVSSVVSFSA